MTAWITTAELAAFVGRDDLDFNPIGPLILDAACQAVRDCLGQIVDFVEDDVVEIRGSGTNTLLIPEMPVVNITSVQRNDADDVIDPDGYALRGRQRLETTTTGDLWLRDYYYALTYDHGWALLPEDINTDEGIYRVPPALRTTALEVAAVGLVAGRTGIGGVRREAIGRYSYELDDQTNTVTVGLTEEHERALYAYASGAKE